MRKIFFNFVCFSESLNFMYAVAAQGHKANFLIFHNRVNLDDIRYYHVNNIIYYPVQLGEPNSRDGNAICHSMYVDRRSEKVLA